MKIIPSNFNKGAKLPLKLRISFEEIFVYLEQIAKNKDHLLYKIATPLLKDLEAYPELRAGFDDFSYLETYNKQISKLLDLLFPDLLATNEIKSASIPFEFTSFKFSKRFHTILENAGEGFEMELRNFDESKMYIMACTFIMAYHYNFHIKAMRPFYFDIPDVKTGFVRHYRTFFNGDFFKVKPLPSAPKVTEEDIKLLLDNYENIELWKKAFPPESYEFNGFGMMTLVDVTSDQIISNIKENLLKKDKESIDKVEYYVSSLFDSKDIQFEFSSYALEMDRLVYKRGHKPRKFTIYNESESECSTYFCNGILTKVFKDREVLAISDLEKYAENTNFNGFSKTLLDQGIQSIILVPIELNEHLLGVMELVSPNKHELNSINAIKLDDIIPVFKIAALRYMDEFDNQMESVIQQHYTSIHDTVKWRFNDAAETYLSQVEIGNTDAKLEEIVFGNVVPLYGQSDIKGSSNARNTAIQNDLIKQLELAGNIFKQTKSLFNLPIYDDLLFRIEDYKKSIKNELNSGDEISITSFLKQDIYPAFNHLETLNPNLKASIDNYMGYIDPKLHVIFDKRKDYEESVNLLNEALTKFIDTKQVEAQKMFPHYFERYKTDGVDYNIYIGQSLVNNKTYNKIYLYNLRLWQLQMMCELENVAYNLKSSLKHPLEIASLILVHSTSLAIRFRMDEKRFDVDGAYNIRYEIIKKRIDKALIKGTKERLTQPRKIAIVYNQNHESIEYKKYIKHLQAMNYLKDPIEELEIEDLQGTSGLKALRVSINYNKKSKEKVSLDDLMNVINDEN